LDDAVGKLQHLLNFRNGEITGRDQTFVFEHILLLLFVVRIPG
jgi:hypothetical protein